MKTTLILRGIVVACALSAASLPALAKNPTQQSAASQQARKATLKKEINAAYAEQQSACKREASGQRAACLKQARQTYQHDLASVPQLLADAPGGSVTERVVSTTTAAPDATQGGASAYGSSGGGSTGSGSGSVDAVPPANGQSGGLPPPIDQPSPVQPTRPTQPPGGDTGTTPPVQ
jgi:hypothetical protein